MAWWWAAGRQHQSWHPPTRTDQTTKELWITSKEPMDYIRMTRPHCSRDRAMMASAVSVMDYFAGLDVAMEEPSICVVDGEKWCSRPRLRPIRMRSSKR